METCQPKVGEYYQVLSLKFSQAMPVCCHRHWVKYNIWPGQSQIVMTGSLSFVLRRGDVSVYLLPERLDRPIDQKDILFCEKELFHWVKILRLSHLLSGCPARIEGCLLGRANAPASLGIVHNHRVWAQNHDEVPSLWCSCGKPLHPGQCT